MNWLIDDGAATREDGFRCALNLDAFEHRVVDAHVQRLLAEHVALLGVPHQEVGVGADGDGALVREEAEILAGAVLVISTKRFIEMRPACTPPSHIRYMRVSMPGIPLGILVNRRAEIFCPFMQNGQWSVETTCRSWCGGRARGLPASLFAERRSAHVLGAFEAGARQVVEGEKEILRARLGEHGEAAIAGFDDWFARAAERWTI